MAETAKSIDFFDFSCEIRDTIYGHILPGTYLPTRFEYRCHGQYMFKVMKKPTYTPRKAEQPDHAWLAIFQVSKRTKKKLRMSSTLRDS
jgi:hypothetical protein